MKHTFGWCTLAAVCALVACGGRGGSGAPESYEIGRAATSTEIVALDIDVRPDGAGLPEGGGTPVTGRAVFASRCAACHGTEGEGTDAGVKLVGRIAGDAFDFGAQASGGGSRTIGSYWPYATTVYDYINRAMPPEMPGSLSPDEIYSVTAWLLWKNSIIGENDRMDRTSLPAVQMPSRNRFVPDDREKSTRVR